MYKRWKLLNEFFYLKRSGELCLVIIVVFSLDLTDYRLREKRFRNKKNTLPK